TPARCCKAAAVPPKDDTTFSASRSHGRTRPGCRGAGPVGTAFGLRRPSARTRVSSVLAASRPEKNTRRCSSRASPEPGVLESVWIDHVVLVPWRRAPKRSVRSWRFGDERWCARRRGCGCRKGLDGDLLLLDASWAGGHCVDPRGGRGRSRSARKREIHDRGR